MTLTEVTRRQYETGCYSGAHLWMRKADLDAVKRPAPVAARYEWARTPDQIHSELMAIRVVVDDEMAANTWKLVDNATGEVLRMGFIT